MDTTPRYTVTDNRTGARYLSERACVTTEWGDVDGVCQVVKERMHVVIDLDAPINEKDGV